MDNVNWLKLKLNQRMANLKSANAQINTESAPKNNVAKNLVQQTQNNIINNVQRNFVNPQQLRMNNLASIDRAVYIKEVLNLPKNMVELLVMVQNNGKTPQTQPQNPQNVLNPQQPQNPQQPNLPNRLPNNNLHNPKLPDLSDLIGKQPTRPDVTPQPNQPNQPNFPNQQPNLPNNPNLPNPLPHPNQPNNPSHIPNHPEHGGHKPQPPTDNNKPNQPLPPKGEFEDQIKNTEDMMNRRQEMIQDKMRNNLPDSSRLVNDRAQHGVRNANLRNPHNQLHNQVRNNIRNNPNILRDQIIQDNDALENLQSNQKTQGMTAEELTAFKQKMASQLDSNVNLSRVSNLLQRNSKMAMNKMVTMMSLATSKGMGDITPLQDTINIINASVSATSQNDSTQTLKNLMLLYLPWLPLQEGVGFDLEIEQDKEEKQFDTFIKIMITTVNYGNVNAVVSLVTGNSVDISITCSEKFPKEKLLKKLQKESNQYSMQSVIDFKKQSPQEQIDTNIPKAKVNLSNVSEVNPYLLLISHAIIRFTIELDATLTIGSQPIED